METMRPDPSQTNEPSARSFEFEPFVLTPPPSRPPAPTPPASRPWRRRVLAVLAVAVVFAAGVGLGNLVAPDTPAVQETALPPTTTAPQIAPEATPAPSTSLAPAVPAPAPVFENEVPLPADEPIAQVAAVLRPSIVQIDTQGGLGSGFVYDASGLIMTAAHVVDGSTDVVVTFADGTKVDGVVVGQDLVSDVAVVSVSVDGPLETAELALDVELAPGQLAVAIGSPFGLEQTITAGIVSNVDRAVVGSDGTVRNLIQTDASINQGNSGGALADRQGRVIGINDLIFTRSGGNDGVGFAIPITYAKQIADQLVAGDDVETARLGVIGTDPQLRVAGALITSVEEGSPAAAAGVEVGDLITGLDGGDIQSFVDLAAAIRAQLPGESVEITILRDGLEITVTADLVSR